MLPSVMPSIAPPAARRPSFCPAAPSWGRLHPALLGLLALVLAGVAFGAWRLLQGPWMAVEAVVRRDFVQSVVASGRVETPHRVAIGATVTATVLRVAVSEGDRVAAGDLLVELQADEQRAALVQAERGVEQARARLRQIAEVQRPVAEGALRTAEANRAAAGRALERAESLRAQGFIGEAAVDEARRAAEVAQAQWQAARQQRAGVAEEGADGQLARAALAQAEAGVALARARLEALRLRAPGPATVLQRAVQPGDVVQPGRPLLQLSPDGPLELVVQIDEKNLRLLRPGQPARAVADAYPGERFDARVDRLLPAVDAQRGAVEVRLSVPQPPAQLRQDMTVSVDVEVARRPQALLAPADAVREGDRDGDRFGSVVWVLRDGRIHRQPVRLGARSDGWVEVLEGLTEGERVVPVSATGAEPGRRARAREAAPR